MAWDGAAIIELVRDRAELVSTNTQFTDTIMLRIVNRALRQVCLEADWPWLRATSAPSTAIGVKTITTPTRWMRTMGLYLTDTGEPLSRVNLKVVRRSMAAGQGRPALYSVDGSVITLAPTPNVVLALTHDWIGYEPTMTLTTDVPLVPELYGDGVVEWAAYKAFQKQQKPDKAITAALDYQAWVKRTRDNINQSREPLGVTPRPGGFM